MRMTDLSGVVTLAALLVSSPAVSRSVSAQESSPPTAQSVRDAISKRLGIWITSNADYRTAENGEPGAYGSHFLARLGNVSATGCLWGETDGEVVGTYWHFFSGWDPVNESLIFYQSNQSGLVGIGHAAPAAPGAPAVAEQTFMPLPGGEAPGFRHRHRTTWILADTMKTESFNWVDGAWQPGRSYTWVRHSDHEAPC